MKLYTTAPLEDPRDPAMTFPRLEEIGYDGAFTFEAKHDPFVPLALAADRTKKLTIGTAIAIAFARNPMNLANLAWGLQTISEGRFLLGLGSQVKPHIENRFSATWSHPAPRMKEIVQAIQAIFDAFEGKAELDFRGRFYKHTLMIPAFNPGPNPYGRPPIYTAGFGPWMTRAAGEVADGFIAHPFHTRKSLLQNGMPWLKEGLAKAGRERKDIDVICGAMVVTADTEEELAGLRLTAKKQLAFYGSTPAYRYTLEAEGLGELHGELNALSKQGRWDEMADRIPDSFLEEVCIIGHRCEIAAKLKARYADIADGISLTNNRAPDPQHWADIIAELKGS
ncbi:MAG: TIGR03617 family F420-dependent LLM class oxidoreductase [Deltaproteobacteria bacterium]